MPQMHLRQSGFAYRACVAFKKKKKKRIQRLKETGDSWYIYHNNGI